MNTQVAALPEGAFSLEDLLMLSPAERASVEADMKEEGIAPPDATPADPGAVPADPATPDPAPAVPDATPAAPVVAPHDRLAELQAAEVAAAKAISDLTAKYDDGEMTTAQFQEQIATVATQKAESMAELRTVQQQVQASDDAWFGMVGQAIESLGLKPNTAELAIYDRVLRDVESNYATLPDPEKFRVAEMEFRRMFPATPGTAKPAQAQQSQQQRTPDDPDTYEIEPDDKNAFGTTVPALRRVPPETYSPDQSRFADIIAMQNAGDVYNVEKALAKLSPAELDRFAQYG
jgi:hypothetical protein